MTAAFAILAFIFSSATLIIQVWYVSRINEAHHMGRYSVIRSDLMNARIDVISKRVTQVVTRKTHELAPTPDRTAPDDCRETGS